MIVVLHPTFLRFLLLWCFERWRRGVEEVGVSIPILQESSYWFASTLLDGGERGEGVAETNEDWIRR